MNIKTIIFAIILSSCWVGCSNKKPNVPPTIQKLDNLTTYSADTSPAVDIHLEKEQVFAHTSEALLGPLTALAVDEAGRVYMADGEQLNISVYTPNGRFLTQLGREGKGPGEFIDLSSIQATENKLFVYDRTQQRAVVFALDSLAHEYVVSLAGNKNQFEELGDAYLGDLDVIGDTFLMSFSEPDKSNARSDWDRIEKTALFYNLGEEGQIISDKLMEAKSSTEIIIPRGAMSIGTPLPFTGKLLTSSSSDGRIYMNWSNDFLIKVYSSTGEYKYAFYYPYEKVPLTAETASGAGIPEAIVENMSSIDIEDTWPALNSIKADDEGRLWVSTIIDDFEAYQWWVLDADDGHLLARFTWPRNKLIEVVKNGKLYTRETD